MHRSIQRCVRFVCLPVALLLATPILGEAQLIYTNGVPDNQHAYAVYDLYSTANDFPLLSTTQLGSFEWYLTGTGQGTATISSNFSWTIFNDEGGTVGSTVLGSGTVTNATGTATGYFCCEGSSYDFTTYIVSNVSFNGLTLGPGQYWLAIGNYADAIDPRCCAGFWATSAQVGNQMQTYNLPGIGWVDTDTEGAFSIYGNESTVPEPSSLALLATGLVGLVPTLRRKLKR